MTEAKKSIESPEATRTSVDDVEVVGAPISPVRTRDSAAVNTKPDLERHITNIETSSESSSDNEEDRVRKREKKQKGGLLSGLAPKSPTTRESVEEPAPTTDAVSTTATKSIVEPNARVSTDPPRESTASSHPDVEKEKAQDSKRIRGFFSKLRNRQSSKGADRQPGSFSAASGKPADDKEVVTTAPVAATTSSSDPRAVSPSSFDRHRDDEGPATGRKSSTDLGDVSSLSSSGLDEDDLTEGRTGRMARALGMKKGKSTDGVKTTDTDLTTGKGVKSDDDDSDQFEEARDHFDEGLAPRPSFGGQAKSASPARETRFHEEV